MGLDYEFLLKLAQEQTKYPLDIIKQLVHTKRQLVGEVYLSDQDSLFLVLDDLGIKLKAPTSPPKKEPFQNIKIEKISDEDLGNKNEIIEKNKNFNMYVRNFIGYFPLVIMIAVFVFLTSFFPDPINSSLISNLFIAAVIGTGIALISAFKIKKRKLPNNEIIFHKFYKVYRAVSKLKYDVSNPNTAQSIPVLKSLIFFISMWTRSSTPNTISELPKSIELHLKQNIIPIFKENDRKKIQEFMVVIRTMTWFCYNYEPTAQILRSFNEALINIHIDKKENNVEVKNWNYLLYFWLIIPVLVGITLYFLFDMVDSTQPLLVLGFSLSISVGLFIGIMSWINKTK